MKKTIKFLAVLLTVLCIALFSCITYTIKNTPDTVYTTGAKIQLDSEYIKCSVQDDGYGSNYQLKFLNVFPVKDVNVVYTTSKSVVLCGNQFGIKIYSNGCVITSISGVLSNGECKNPAYEAGLRKGDIIISINGNMIQSNDDVERVVANSDTRLKIVYERNGKKYNASAYSVVSSVDGQKRLGIWIKDSIAGIGTATFYNPNNGITAGLGHGIYENESDVLMPLNDGAVCDVEPCGIIPSKSGYIGEISAKLDSKNYGYIIENSECGIYSSGQTVEGTVIEVADAQDVKTGNAQLYLSLDDGECKYYDCIIKKIDYKSEYKNMIVEITDNDLLNKTGGIVQGMSGTPIIQNGKIVGALTHVFVDDCTKGYGVFAITMAMKTESLAEKLN